jgi:hypothetical protein
MAHDGTAVIRASDRVGHESPNQGDPWPWEIALNRFGHNKYDFTLEVRLPGQEPFSVTDRFTVPKKAENLGLLDSGRKIPAGIELPVRVDGRGRIEIDWEAWMASPGRKEGVQAGRAAANAAAMRAHLDKNPKLRDKVRANNKQAALAWAGAVQLGSLTREQFERQVQTEIDHGRMDPADAEAARAQISLGE